MKFLVRVSYLEIYNEEVRDLLGKDQTVRLEVKEHPGKGVYVKDLSVYMVNNADDMDKLMNKGNTNRSIGKGCFIYDIPVESNVQHKISSIFCTTGTCYYAGIKFMQIYAVYLVSIMMTGPSRVGISGIKISRHYNGRTYVL